MDYINPFSGMGGDATIESPFLRAMDRGTRHNLAAPFIEMAQKNQQMDMQKKQMEHAEFASPLAQQLRQQTMQTGLVKQQQEANALPWRTAEEISNAKKTIESNPAITQKMIADAEQAAIAARGKPVAQFFNDVAAVNEQIKKLPEGARPLAARHFVEQFKAKNPGAKLPAFLENYDATHWDLASLVAINSASHQQDMIKEKSKEGAAMDRAQLSAETQRYVSDNAYQRAVDAAALRGGPGGSGAPKNDSQAYNMAITALSDPNATPQQREAAIAQARPHIIKMATQTADRMGLDIIRKEAHIKSVVAYEEDKLRALGSGGGAPAPTPGQPSAPGNPAPQAAPATALPKNITILDYIDWFCKKNPDGPSFSYFESYEGFNVPGHIAEQWLSLPIPDPNRYDLAMQSIISGIKARQAEPYYIIGVLKKDRATLDHELAHGFFCLIPEYREQATKLVNELPEKAEIYEKLVKEGYNEVVLIDEAQAYLATGLFLDLLAFEHVRAPFMKLFSQYRNKIIGKRKKA